MKYLMKILLVALLLFITLGPTVASPSLNVWLGFTAYLIIGLAIMYFSEPIWQAIYFKLSIVLLLILFIITAFPNIISTFHPHLKILLEVRLALSLVGFLLLIIILASSFFYAHTITKQEKELYEDLYHRYHQSDDLDDKKQFENRTL